MYVTHHIDSIGFKEQQHIPTKIQSPKFAPETTSTPRSSLTSKGFCFVLPPVAVGGLRRSDEFSLLPPEAPGRCQYAAGRRQREGEVEMRKVMLLLGDLGDLVVLLCFTGWV